MNGTSSKQKVATESCRQMRGTADTAYEYIRELQSETTVGIDVAAHVIVPEYLIDTCKGSHCEVTVN